jgi:hypothetical protein
MHWICRLGPPGHIQWVVRTSYHGLGRPLVTGTIVVQSMDSVGGSPQRESEAATTTSNTHFLSIVIARKLQWEWMEYVGSKKCKCHIVNATSFKWPDKI